MPCSKSLTNLSRQGSLGVWRYFGADATPGIFTPAGSFTPAGIFMPAGMPGIPAMLMSPGFMSAGQGPVYLAVMVTELLRFICGTEAPVVSLSNLAVYSELKSPVIVPVLVVTPPVPISQTLWKVTLPSAP